MVRRCVTQTLRKRRSGSTAFSRSLNRHATLLYQGQAARIAIELDKAARAQADDLLTCEAAFFRNHLLRMNYLEMREGAWLIGSSMVESGSKQFKARFSGPGMRWSRKSAEHLLPIRSAILSHRFHDLWNTAKNLSQYEIHPTSNFLC